MDRRRASGVGGPLAYGKSRRHQGDHDEQEGEPQSRRHLLISSDVDAAGSIPRTGCRRR
jgi:hypothetical protein